MAHTPGPWFVNGDCVEADGPEGPRDVTVAVVHGHPHNTVRAANARLIAAAPDLLAVCQAIANDLSLFQFTDGEYRLSEQSARVILQSLREVIAKAEGRSE